ILPVQFFHVDEHVVIQFDTVLVLMGGAAVFGKGRKGPRSQRAVGGATASGTTAAATQQAGVVRRHALHRRIPLVRNARPRVGAKSVVVRRTVISVGV